MANGFVLSNFNSLFQGNRELENATSQVHSLRYFKYNLFNFENIFASANYSRKIDAVKTNANFVGINQSSKPYNSNIADENLFGTGSYQRTFNKYYKASVNVTLNWSKFYNIQNNLQIVTESFTQSYRTEFSTNFKKYPNLELGFEKQINKYSGQTFFTDTPSINDDNFTQFATRTSQYVVQPRYIIFSLKYNL